MRAWLLVGSAATAVRSAAAAAQKCPCLNSARPRLSSTPAAWIERQSLFVGGRRFPVLLLLGEDYSQTGEGRSIVRIARGHCPPGLRSPCNFALLFERDGVRWGRRLGNHADRNRAGKNRAARTSSDFHFFMPGTQGSQSYTTGISTKHSCPFAAKHCPSMPAWHMELRRSCDQDSK